MSDEKRALHVTWCEYRQGGATCTCSTGFGGRETTPCECGHTEDQHDGRDPQPCGVCPCLSFYEPGRGTTPEYARHDECGGPLIVRVDGSTFCARCGDTVLDEGRTTTPEVMCSHTSEPHGVFHPEGLCPHVVSGPDGLTSWPCPDQPGRGTTPDVEPLSAYDLRLRSLDRQADEPISLCSKCDGPAYWSVWLHTPEWGSQGGATYVLCTKDALDALIEEVDRA